MTRAFATVSSLAVCPTTSASLSQRGENPHRRNWSPAPIDADETVFHIMGAGRTEAARPTVAARPGPTGR